MSYYFRLTTPNISYKANFKSICHHYVIKKIKINFLFDGASKRRWAQNTPIIISRNRVKGDNSSKAGHLGRDRNECTLKKKKNTQLGDSGGDSQQGNTL